MAFTLSDEAFAAPAFATRRTSPARNAETRHPPCFAEARLCIHRGPRRKPSPRSCTCSDTGSQRQRLSFIRRGAGCPATTTIRVGNSRSYALFVKQRDEAV